MSFDPRIYLDNLALVPDEEIDLGLAALSLAAPRHAGISLSRYVSHLDKLSSDTADRHTELLAAGAEDNPATCLAALKHALADGHGYEGDQAHYDSIENADLMRVIDRGMGMPIALSILYIYAARSQGWQISGLGIPGHFVCRLERGGEMLIFDPFHRCQVLEAPDLRQLVKNAMGEQAELSAHYFEPVSNRAILIRLQNNIKHRLIDAGDYEEALAVIELMRKIDPHEFRLLLDAGVLYAKVGQRKTAITMLEDYIEKVPDPAARQDAVLLLRELQDNLN